MNGRLLLGVCMTLLACGSTSSHREGPGEEATGGADAGGATLELSLDVVQRVDWLWAPAAQAHVRIDGSGTSLEVLSDDDGHVEARVGADTG
ncbi:MAG TPA: hypothetical protein VD867_03830, partial [Burkholderiales bacterium]|nr:hypothetical protein [Burkholderiales bacterium]